MFSYGVPPGSKQEKLMHGGETATVSKFSALIFDNFFSFLPKSVFVHDCSDRCCTSKNQAESLRESSFLNIVLERA